VLLDLVLLHSTDEGETWTPEYLETDGRTGSFPSMAMSSKGRLAVSYYACGSAADRLCDAAHDGLLMSIRGEGGWTQTVVNADAEQLDGTYTAMAFMGEEPVIAARSVVKQGPEGEQTLNVYFGTPIEP
jgi:hypothetical protein